MRRARITSNASLTTAVCALVAAAGLSTAVPVHHAFAQPGFGAFDPENTQSPVFVNDDPAATEALGRLGDHLRSGNLDQSVRAVSELLKNQRDSLVPIINDAGNVDTTLHVAVRDRVMAIMLDPASRAGLDAYRLSESADAQALLATGNFAEVEARYLLTPAGLEAALCVAQQRFEAAHFAAAWRTLNQLERHPDLIGEPARRAAALASSIARVWNDPRASDLASRWHAAPVAAALTPPAAVLQPPRSGLTPGPAVDLTELVAKPIASVLYTEDGKYDVMRGRPSVPDTDSLPPLARVLRTFPTIAGAHLLITNGRDLIALDRTTLAEAWRTDLVIATGLDRRDQENAKRPGPDDARHLMRGEAEDVGTVAVSAGPSPIAIVTLTPGEPRQDDTPDQIAAIDVATGTLRWTKSMVEIDGNVGEIRSRGPALIDGDVVVLTCRKNQPERRLTALYLVALDLYTGQPRWTRLVGSAGSLPYPQSPQVSHAGTIADGIIYRSDRLGVMGAYEVLTGRPLWVRRLTPEPQQSEATGWSWDVNAPIIVNGSLFVVSADAKQVLKINATTGQLRGAVDAELWGKPNYLLRAGDRLIGVGGSRIASCPVEHFGEGRPDLSPVLDAPGIRGRVLVAGDRLLVPVTVPTTGLLPIDPLNPGDLRAALVPLDALGNVAVVDRSLIVADDSRVHQYLAWPDAQALLTRQSEAAPANPAPSVSLVQVAYRAGHPEAIEPALQRAITSLGSLAEAAAQPIRAQLVGSLLTMIEVSDPDAAQTGGSSRPVLGAPKVRVTPPPALPADLLTRVLTTMEPLCTTAEHRATRLLLLGADQWRRGQGPEAVASYQAILSDPSLNLASYAGRRVTTAAGIEAGRRLQVVVQTAGRTVYAAADRALAQALAALPATIDAAALESLAERFPLAQQTPDIWSRAATAHRAANRQSAEARALELGLAAASRIPDAPPELVGEISGRLVWSLRDRGLLSAAAETLQRVRRTYPQLTLTRDRQPLDERALDSSLAAELSAQRRWPSVGRPRGQQVHVFEKLGLMEPEIQPTTPESLGYFMVRDDAGRVGMIVPPAAKDPEGPGAPMKLAYTSPPSENLTQLIRCDPRGAVLYTSAGLESGVLWRISAPAGTLAWRSQPFSTYFPAWEANEGPRQRPSPNQRIDTPQGYRSIWDIVVTGDDRTLAMVERSGRALVIDADTGRVLWNALSDVHRVFDASLIASTLVIIGQQDLRTPGGTISGTRDVILLIDARTGQVRRSVPPPADAGAFRWVRVTNRGEVIIGMGTGVFCIDPETGDTVWSLRNHPAASARDAWLVGDRLLLMSEDRGMWIASTASGQLLGGQLDLRGRAEGSGTITISPRGPDPAQGIAIRTSQGLVLLSTSGALIATDGLSVGGSANDDLLPPLPIADGFLALGLSRTPIPLSDTLSLYPLSIIDAKSGQLVGAVPLALGTDPIRIAAIDDRVAVTAGHTTVIYWSPKE